MTRRYRKVMRELLREVVSGELPDAAHLPTIREIAARFACNRDVVREAVRALEERRIVDVRAGHGQHVLPDDRWDLLDRDVACAVLQSRRDLDLRREAIEALRLVETQVATLAAERARSGDFGMLEDALTQMRATAASSGAPASDEGFVDAECAFHRTLTTSAGNRWMACMLESLHPAIVMLRHQRAPERDRLVIILHERIVAGLRTRDHGAVATAVDDYVRRTGSWLGA